MEIKADQISEYLESLFKKQDFQTLANQSLQVTQQRPDMAVGWRYYGIANVLMGEEGKNALLQASLLGDAEAETWLNIIKEFEYYPKGSVHPSHIFHQFSWMYLRQKYMDYPIEVTIETYAICNAACTFCPYPTMERKGDRMSDELIDKVIDDLKAIPKDHFFRIAPFKMSDPFLDKRIFSVCEKINTELPNAILRLFTNGSPLTDKIVDRIADIKNVQHLWISLNEYEKNAYEQTMKLPYEKTIEKLNALHKRVEKGYPHLIVVSRVCNYTEEDLKFKNFLSQNYPLFECFLMARSDWTGQVEIDTVKSVPQTACGRWYEVNIMASGKVALCCMDGEGKHVVGDINHQSVLDVYNSPGYKKMRQYSPTRLAAAAPCDTCIYS